MNPIRKLKMLYTDIRIGLYNFWYFKKEIWNFRWYDYSFTLDVISKCIDYMDKNWHKSIHLDSEKTHKKIHKLKILYEFVSKVENEYDIYSLQNNNSENTIKNAYKEISKFWYNPEKNSVPFLEFWD